MIEMSTLTGAMVVALAFTYAGLFCNSEELASNLTAAGKSSKEEVWRMPLH